MQQASPPQRILITGTSGFAGRRFAAHLRAAGHDVVGTVNSRKGHPSDIALDLGRDDPRERIDGGFDVIVHNAALMSDASFSRPLRDVNTRGTERMLAFAKERGCAHFVQISSVAAYGLRCTGRDRDEDTARSPGGLFPFDTENMRTKADAERRVERAGLPYTILRLPVILGAGSTFSLPAMRKAFAAGEVPYYRRNDGLVSLLCEQSLGPALEAFLARGPQGAAFNVCDHHVAWNELVERYGRALGAPVPWKKRGIAVWIDALRDGHTGYLISNGILSAHFPSARMEALGITLDADLDRAVADEVAEFSEALAARP